MHINATFVRRKIWTISNRTSRSTSWKPRFDVRLGKSVLSCNHCNNIKNDKFTPILDCTKVAVDKKIAFRRHSEPFMPDKLEITALEDDVETRNTVALLNEVYYGSTAQKIEEAKIIRKQLSKELNAFEECVTDYNAADGEDKKDLELSIMMKLKWNAPLLHLSAG